MTYRLLIPAAVAAALVGAALLPQVSAGVIRGFLGSSSTPVFDGTPRVIDGDGLEIAGVSLRLHGIDAPEMGQMCTGASGRIDCGELARDGLVAMIGADEVSCAQEDYDSRYNRPVVSCTVDGTNLNERLVAAGYAVAYRRYSTRYVAAETTARAAGLGIWGTDMIAPEAWRHTDPQVSLRPQARPGAERAAEDGFLGRLPGTGSGADPSLPSILRADCTIKGNISGNGRIYHMPGQAYYDETRISASRGERWFCSEEEAQAAGWRRARM